MGYDRPEGTAPALHEQCGRRVLSSAKLVLQRVGVHRFEVLVCRARRVESRVGLVEPDAPCCVQQPRVAIEHIARSPPHDAARHLVRVRA
eukprot:6177834-Pleurochrysis_carterae.AAC.4